MIRTSPTILRLDGLPEDELRRQLTYIDKSVDYELQKARHSSWLLKKLGEEAWKEHLAALKEKRVQCLLLQDKQGFYTYSGLESWLALKFRTTSENRVHYPEPKLIPWDHVPDKKLRPYQEKMLEALLDVKHGAVEVGTGLGKSFVILHLAKELGLKTVVMTPSVSIAEQIHREFLHAFGRKYVGKFYGGKKDSQKLFVVGVDDSLTKIDPEDAHWKNLSQAQVFIADESHLCPATSLKKVCFGLLSEAPYRFFFSGTQMRNDGLDLLLHAITGKIVFRMSVQEGVDQGYLAKPMFRMIKCSSETGFESRDANEMTRAHLYYNPGVNAKAAELANLMVEELGRPTVILVQEIEQFNYLLPYLRHSVRFAHGGVTAENRGKIPKQYWESDPDALVQEFNAGKFSILVGTSCITTGTDIQAVKAVIYLQGGKSEIKVRQAIGRGTRKPDGKLDCFFLDMDVENVESVHRHAAARQQIYESVYPDFQEMVL